MGHTGPVEKEAGAWRDGGPQCSSSASKLLNLKPSLFKLVVNKKALDCCLKKRPSLRQESSNHLTEVILIPYLHVRDQCMQHSFCLRANTVLCPPSQSQNGSGRLSTGAASCETWWLRATMVHHLFCVLVLSCSPSDHPFALWLLAG